LSNNIFDFQYCNIQGCLRDTALMQCKHLFDKEENNALQSSRLNTHISKCGSIKITKKSNEKNLIVFDVSHPNGLKNILKRRVFVKYDIDVTRVDDSILNVPAVAGIINIAWAFGIDICIDTLDRSYLKSLEKIKQVMRHWHPYFPMTTQIHVNKVITNNFSNNGFGLLFTGGIDSTTSYIKHKDEKINLINVIEEESRRALKSKEVFKMMRRLRKFARNEEVKINFIKTNLTPSESIQAYFFERFGLRLWEDVSHGMILTGLCAPLTVTNGIGTVLIASSITPSYKYSWGSHPRIDNRISWADIKVRNDKYRMSRFQKMGVIKAYIEKTGNIPTLRSCDLPLSGNCGKCIKCLRTITGLVLRGIDPNKVGFPDVTEHTLQLIKTRILNLERPARTHSFEVDS